MTTLQNLSVRRIKWLSQRYDIKLKLTYFDLNHNIYQYCNYVSFSIILVYACWKCDLQQAICHRSRCKCKWSNRVSDSWRWRRVGIRWRWSCWSSLFQNWPSPSRSYYGSKTLRLWISKDARYPNNCFGKTMFSEKN